MNLQVNNPIYQTSNYIYSAKVAGLLIKCLFPYGYTRNLFYAALNKNYHLKHTALSEDNDVVNPLT